MRELSFLPEGEQGDIAERVGAVFQSAEPMFDIGVTRDWNTERQTVESAIELAVARGEIGSAVALLESLRSAIARERDAIMATEEELQRIALHAQTLAGYRQRTAATLKGEARHRFQQQVEEDSARLRAEYEQQFARVHTLREREPELLEQYRYFTRYFFFLKALAAHRSGQPIEIALQIANPEEEEIATALQIFFEEHHTFDDNRLAPLSQDDIRALIDRRELATLVSEATVLQRMAGRGVEHIETQCRGVVEQAKQSGYPELITLAQPISLETEWMMQEGRSPDLRRRGHALRAVYEQELSALQRECMSHATPFLKSLSKAAVRQCENVMASIVHGFSFAFGRGDTSVPRMDEIYSIDPEHKLAFEIAGYELQNDNRIPVGISEHLHQRGADSEEKPPLGRHLILERIPPLPASRRRGMELDPLSGPTNILSDFPNYIIFALPTIVRHYPHVLGESVTGKAAGIIEQAGGMTAFKNSTQVREKFNQALEDHFYDAYLFAGRLVQLSFNNRVEARPLVVSERAREQLITFLKQRLEARYRAADGREHGESRSDEIRGYIAAYLIELRDRIQFYTYGARIMPVLPDDRGVPKIINAFLGVQFHRVLAYLFEERVMKAVMERYIDTAIDELRLPGIVFSARAGFLAGLKLVYQHHYCGEIGEAQFQQIAELYTKEESERPSLSFGAIDIESFPRSLKALNDFQKAISDIGFDLSEGPRAWGDLLRSVTSGELIQFLLDL